MLMHCLKNKIMKSQTLIALFILYSLNNMAQVSSPPVNYDVPLIPQPTKVSCWAGSMAMIISYKNKEEMSPENLVNKTGRSLYQSYGWDELDEVRNLYKFKSVIDVPSNTSNYYLPSKWYEWLSTYGPLWYTAIWDANANASHAMVITGIDGDIDDEHPEKTFVYINNPWDIHTTFNNDPVEFDKTNSGTSEKVNFIDFAKLFGTWGYDDSHANYRIMYLPN